MSDFSSFTEMDVTPDPSSLDALLDAPLVAGTAAAAVAKKNYQLLQSFQNVTSFSMQEVFKSCPREFQLMKLAAATRTPSDRENIDTCYGHALGAAVATYDKTGDFDKAVLDLFLGWTADLFLDDSYKKTPKNKSFAAAYIALQKYVRFRQEELSFLDEYEQVEYEYTFSLNCEDAQSSDDYNSYYVGHTDELYRHKLTGSHLVKENKTAGDLLVNPAKWSNSEQTTSYSAVVSAKGGTAYDVLYTVYSTSGETWHFMSFPKDKLAKVHFLQDQLFIAADIRRYAEANYFPKRGSSCIRFGRECEFYGLCDIDTTRQFGMKFKDLPIVVETSQLDVVEKYHDHLQLSQLLESLRDASA